MKLIAILESTVGWVGPIRLILGSGQPYTLNYGTGDVGRPPFIYVPVPLSVVRSAIRHLRHATAWFDQAAMIGGVGEPPGKPGVVIIPDVGRRLKHVGEAHFTVCMAPELFQALDDPAATLQERGMCRPGWGMPVEVRHTGNFKVLRSVYYRDTADPEGPFLVAEVVDVPAMGEIRTALGLSATPKLPPGITSAYVPHVTLGFVAATDTVDRDYVALHGRHPRHRVSA